MLFFRPSIQCNGSEHFPFDSYGMPRFHGNILYTIYCILYHLAPVPAARPEPNGKTIERVNQLVPMRQIHRNQDKMEHVRRKT